MVLNVDDPVAPLSLGHFQDFLFGFPKLSRYYQHRLFYQHRHLHRQSGVIIGLPQVYCGVGKTVFIVRLTDPLDLC